ncbi:MAG: KH domain-containing protein [Myxococcaceae bacterium]|nr:KH domain-containing protein [Myxococcaceae bacterium]
MEELIAYLAKSLVDHPDQVEVRTSEADGGKLFELKVAQEDVGKVIGRDGRTVNAIRTLLSAAAQKQGARARLEILDDRRGQQADRGPKAEPPAAEPSGQ